MKTPIRAFAAVLAFFSATAHAAVLGPTRASDLVNVVAFPGFSGVCCSASETAFDITFDADGERQPFVIPPGKVFVVTGIEWNSFLGTPNRQTLAVLSLSRPTGCDGLFANSTALADGAGSAGNTLTVPNGLRIRPGQKLCLFMSNGSLNTARATGYLAKDN
jgi:hypothetical protein